MINFPRIVTFVLGVCMLVIIGGGIVVAAQPQPQSYPEAVRLTLVRRGITPTTLQVDLCPAGPMACARQLQGRVSLVAGQRYDGSFFCAQGAGDCQLSVPALELANIPMPDTAAAGSRMDRLRAQLAVWLKQGRAVVRAWFPCWSGDSTRQAR
jgi:hypothetical protein